MIGIQHFRHHGRFYLAAIAGIIVWFTALALPWPLRALISGDAFFGVYLAMMAVLAVRITQDGLRQRAGVEDEGILLLIMLLALATIVFSLGAIFMVLNHSDPEPVELVLAVASVPLGWLVLHTIAAFHYVHLYYSEEDSGCLAFPGDEEPGAWDFLYFSFVIGMTAQVSDVAVQKTTMRRRVLVHSVIAFFYNTADPSVANESQLLDHDARAAASLAQPFLQRLHVPSTV